MNLTNLIPGVPQAKLILAAVGLAAVAVPSAGWMITARTLGGVRAWQDDVIAATSSAAHVTDKTGRPALLNARDVPRQVMDFGAALDRVKVVHDQAVATNLANKTRIESAQDAVTKEQTNAIDRDLAAARAAGAADYARRMHLAGAGAALRGDAGQPAAAEAGDPATAVAGAGGVSLLDEDDVRICGDNTVKALRWQAFGREIGAIPQ